MARLTEEARNTLREGERKLEEKFMAEFSAQDSLVNLYKSHIEEQTIKVKNLNKVITDLQKQENIIKDQNRNIMDQVENMNKHVSEVTTNILNGGKDSSSKSQLTANINYLRQEKDILTEELKVSQAKTSRIMIQLDSYKQENNDIKKELEEKKKKELDGDDVVNNLKKELEEAITATASKDEEQKTLKERLAAKEAEMKKLRENAAQLKKIGTSFRTRFQEEETKNKALTVEKKKLVEKFRNRIANLEAETEELKKEKEEEAQKNAGLKDEMEILAKKNAAKDSRARLVLGNAKERIRLKDENNKLRLQIESFSPGFSVSPSLKRARESTTVETEMVFGFSEEEGSDRPPGQLKKPKSKGE